MGSVYYMAPEMLASGNYNQKCDMWSCGVILYLLLCGYPPYNGANEKEIAGKIKTEELSFEFEEWNSITPICKSFVKSLLVKDPTQRITAQMALKNVWIKEHTHVEEFDMNILKKYFKILKTFKVRLSALTSASREPRSFNRPSGSGASTSSPPKRRRTNCTRCSRTSTRTVPAQLQKLTYLQTTA